MKPLPTVPRHLAVAFRSFVASCALTIAATAGAQAPNAPAPDTTRATAPPLGCRAARLTEPVKIDGVLDEHVWQNGNAITEFKQRDPDEGAAPSQRTEVRVAYDDDALYVGARLHDDRARLDRRRACRAATCRSPPTASRSTSIRSATGAAATTSWSTPPARCTTARSPTTAGRTTRGTACGRRRRASTTQGWTAEMRIPYSQLRFARSRAAGVGRQLPPRHPAQQRGGCSSSTSPRRRAASCRASPSCSGIDGRPGRRGRSSCCPT